MHFSESELAIVAGAGQERRVLSSNDHSVPHLLRLNRTRHSEGLNLNGKRSAEYAKRRLLKPWAIMTKWYRIVKMRVSCLINPDISLYQVSTCIQFDPLSCPFRTFFAYFSRAIRSLHFSSCLSIRNRVLPDTLSLSNTYTITLE